MRRMSSITIRRSMDMDAESEKPKFTFSKLIQLIGLGAGCYFIVIDIVYHNFDPIKLKFVCIKPI
jgi:hypothetical protein